LRSLVNSSGLEVINQIEEKGSTLSTHQGVIHLLARKKNPI